MGAVLKLSRDDAISDLEKDYGIRGAEIYLLELIPLIEMIWADGPPTDAEIRLVYEFALRRLAELDQEAEGMDVLTVEQVNAFLERFLHVKPSPEKLRALRRAALPVIFDHSDRGVNDRRRRMILEYCLDIAAASVSRYPYEAHERIAPAEKALVLELAETWRPA